MNNEVLYYYLRDEKNHPYGCVAIQESASGNGKSTVGFRFARSATTSTGSTLVVSPSVV